MRSAMVSMMIGILVAAGQGMPAGAGRLHVTRWSGETRSDGSRWSSVSVECAASVTGGWSARFTTTLSFPGQPVGPDDRLTQTNQAGDLVGLTLQAATHTTNTFLLLAGRNVVMLRVIDLNASVGDLCARSHRRINSRDVWLEKLEGRSVWLGSEEYRRAIYHLRVSIGSDGGISLASYRARPWAEAVRQRAHKE